MASHVQWVNGNNRDRVGRFIPMGKVFYFFVLVIFINYKYTFRIDFPRIDWP